VALVLVEDSADVLDNVESREGTAPS
jgi:hypothetical protein